MLEMAILGLLHEAPMHGYELRKRLTGLLGAFRAFSYGSLYPTLRRLQADGLISEDADPEGTGTRRRARRVYHLTVEGKERFTELLADTGPQTFTDDGFGVHLAFFSRTPAEVRLRILEGRRRQVEERREGLRSQVAKASKSLDRYTHQLHRLGLETSEREVRWLNELIAAEGDEPGPEPPGEDGPAPPDGPPRTPTDPGPRGSAAAAPPTTTPTSESPADVVGDEGEARNG